MDPNNWMIEEVPNAEPEDSVAFMTVTLNEVVSKYRQWMQTMPDIKPYYAMKCNNDPQVLKLLAELGIGFDCASKKEIETILNLGVDPSRILYANPCKSRHALAYAASVGVNAMTFDNEMELYKIKQHHPKARTLIRIKVDDSSAEIALQAKFGCELQEVQKLIDTAKKLKIAVIGVSFYAGHICSDLNAYSKAISLCHKVFEIAEAAGILMEVVDIGGGFPGVDDEGLPLSEIAITVKKAMVKYFNGYKVKLIAEPGTFFVQSAFKLYTYIIGKRERYYHENEKVVMYFINEGIYGMFHFALFHNTKYKPISLVDSPNVPKERCSIWGPTCDSVDCVVKDCLLPSLKVGDLLIFDNMGAYTIVTSTEFNGFKPPSIQYMDLKDLPSKILEFKGPVDY